MVDKPKNREKISPAKLTRIAGIFNSLAYPVRLQILEMLEDNKEYPVFEILDHVNIEASLLSHHLAKMKSAGILISIRRGRNIYYKLGIQEITKLLDCIYSCELNV